MIPGNMFLGVILHVESEKLGPKAPKCKSGSLNSKNEHFGTGVFSVFFNLELGNSILEIWNLGILNLGAVEFGNFF